MKSTVLTVTDIQTIRLMIFQAVVVSRVQYAENVSTHVRPVKISANRQVAKYVFIILIGIKNITKIKLGHRR